MPEIIEVIAVNTYIRANCFFVILPSLDSAARIPEEFDIPHTPKTKFSGTSRAMGTMRLRQSSRETRYSAQAASAPSAVSTPSAVNISGRTNLPQTDRQSTEVRRSAADINMHPCIGARCAAPVPPGIYTSISSEPQRNAKIRSHMCLLS